MTNCTFMKSMRAFDKLVGSFVQTYSFLTEGNVRKSWHIERTNERRTCHGIWQKDNELDGWIIKDYTICSKWIVSLFTWIVSFFFKNAPSRDGNYELRRRRAKRDNSLPLKHKISSFLTCCAVYTALPAAFPFLDPWRCWFVVPHSIPYSILYVTFFPLKLFFKSKH